MSNEQKYVRPEEACRVLKVSSESLKRWAKAGKLEFVLTSGGHRRYNLAKFLNPESVPKPIVRKCIVYARVSSSSQKEDLERQVRFLHLKYPNHQVIQDVGSGINFKRKGLKTILGLVIRGQLQELVVTHKDRLCRFGFELIAELIRYGNGKIVVLNEDEIQSPEQELCRDLLSIVTVFSARIHRFRSGKNRKALKKAEKTKEAEREGSEGSSKVPKNTTLSREEY